jgi:hypothetical protein
MDTTHFQSKFLKQKFFKLRNEPGFLLELKKEKDLTSVLLFRTADPSSRFPNLCHPVALMGSTFVGGLTNRIFRDFFWPLWIV